LELSAEAFISLSKRFKASTKDWLKADKAAQQTRSRKPEVMDIYDTAKGKGM
jgi:flagellar motility protein MotE (MotC chaperone)